VALKILLADDSMTAQNMGKKILVEAGYEVVTVSNGAAAVKKIAEHKPDLAILDVFMPGYTGLEVCERIKNAPETAKTAVLLTVGKMEPFKAEEGHKVKADGLLIKPFEASDLLATVKKLGEKLRAPAAMDYDKTVKLVRPIVPEFSDDTYQEWKTGADETPLEEIPTQKIEVPVESAAAPAFGDVLEAPAAPDINGPPPELQNAQEYELAVGVAAGAEAAPAFGVQEAPPDFTLAPVEAASAPSAPAFDFEDLHLEDLTEPKHPPYDLAPMEAPLPVIEPAEVEPAEASVLPEAATDELAPPLDLAAPAEPVVASAPLAELEFTSAPQAHDVAGEILPELEPTILQETIPVEVTPDAALVTSTEELSQFTTKFGVEHPDEIPVGVAAESEIMQEIMAPVAEPEPLLEVEAAPAEIAPEPAPQELAPEVAPQELAEAVPQELAPEPVVQEIVPAPAPAAPPNGDALAFAAELQRALEGAPVAAPEPTAPPLEEHVEMAEAAPVLEPQAAEPIPAGEIELAPAAVEEPAAETLEAAPAEVLPETAPAAFVPAPIVAELTATHGIDETVIANIIERVIERLKPELVAEITKELSGK
jgi:CheY-like chemotaxis protein